MEGERDNGHLISLNNTGAKLFLLFSGPVQEVVVFPEHLFMAVAVPYPDCSST